MAQALYLKGVGDVLDGLVGATTSQPCNEQGGGGACDSDDEPAHHAAVSVGADLRRVKALENLCQHSPAGVVRVSGGLVARRGRARAVAACSMIGVVRSIAVIG